VGFTSGRTGGLLWTWAPLAEIGVGLATRAAADRRAGYPPWLVVSHPLVVAVLLVMGVASIVRFRVSGTVAWRDRQYDVGGSVVSEPPC
jgi:hypothetical protein